MPGTPPLREIGRADQHRGRVSISGEDDPLALMLDAVDHLTEMVTKGAERLGTQGHTCGACRSGPSRDAELVTFGVEHHDMAKMLAVGLLAQACRPSGNQLVNLHADTLLSFGHGPGRLAGYPDVDVHPVLGRLALSHPKKADRHALALRIDD